MTPLLVPLVSGAAVAFWICAPLMVIGALGMVLSRKAVYSALFLALVMVCLAVQYAAQAAPFLFVVQIIVYTGAIMMLFLFVVMLVGVDADESMVEVIKGQRVASLLAAGGLVILLVAALSRTFVSAPVGFDAANAASEGHIQGLAALIFGRYVMAFEATAALLITAAVGAMVLANGERITPRQDQTTRVKARLAGYAATGAHPGPRPSSGVFARHNSIATPALLPDGTVSEASISPTLAGRGVIVDAPAASLATARAFESIESHQGEEDE